jgi:hypothetical protein
MSLLRRRSRPIKRWPEIRDEDGPVRGNVKVVSVPQLEALMRDAAARGWSPHGRPEWVADHRHLIERVVVVLSGPDAPGRYRCTAVAFSKRGDGARMMIDLTDEAFDDLPDASLEQLVTITRSMLDGIPMTRAPEEEPDNDRR